MENLIGSKEAAEILGYTSSYMRKLCVNKESRDKLKARKMGRDWFFEKDEIKAISNKIKNKRSLSNLLK